MTRRLIQPRLLAALALSVSTLARAQTETQPNAQPGSPASDQPVPPQPPVQPTPVAPQAAPPSPASVPVAQAQAPAPAPAPAPAIVPSRLTRPKWGWDVNLEGAYGRYFPDHQGFGFGRVRGGLLYSADPIYYAMGLTYEWSSLAAATFGIQAEALHIESGVWVQAGALGDTQVHPGAQLALGWSVLGVEAQYRKFDPSDWGWALVGKLRIPVTFIAKAFE